MHGQSQASYNVPFGKGKLTGHIKGILFKIDFLLQFSTNILNSSKYKSNLNSITKNIA